MEVLLPILNILVGLGGLVCAIIVLTKLFPAEGALKGILGIICGLYTFIWGWMNADRFNLRKVMMIWTALIILAVIIGVAGGAMTAVR